MKPPGPHNRALRQLAADLAERPNGEIADVLHRLAPERRQRVQALLGEFHRTGAPEIVTGLSPWLAERLVAPSAAAVTDHAAQALRRCAASVAGTAFTVETRHPSLLSRLTSRKPPARVS